MAGYSCDEEDQTLPDDEAGPTLAHDAHGQGEGPPPDDGQEVPHSNLDLATSKDSVVMLCAC